MTEPIPARTLGAIGLDPLVGHEEDVCPECGGLKRAEAQLCQDCHLLTVAVAGRERKSRARNLARMHREGRRLVLEPHEGSEFEKAIGEVLRWAWGKRGDSAG